MAACAFLSLRVFAVRNIGDIFNYSISHALCLLEAHFRIQFVLVSDGCFDSLGLNAISKAFLTHWHFQRGILWQKKSSYQQPHASYLLGYNTFSISLKGW